MMRSLIVLFAVALLLGCGSAGAAPKGAKAVSPCVPIEHETIVCKVGERVFRIIHDSVSAVEALRCRLEHRRRRRRHE